MNGVTFSEGRSVAKDYHENDQHLDCIDFYNRHTLCTFSGKICMHIIDGSCCAMMIVVAEFCSKFGQLILPLGLILYSHIVIHLFYIFIQLQALKSHALEISRNREKEHAFLGEELGEYKQVEVSSMRKSENNYAKWPKTTSCCGQAWAKETV